MNNKIDDLYERLIKKNKYVFLRIFLENNKVQIINSIKSKVSYKNIYSEFKEISNLDIKYKYFCKILSEFKLKNIYNQDINTITPKEKEIKQPEILAAKIDDIQKNNSQGDADDEKASEPSSENKSSRKERLQAIKNKDEKIIDVQKNQDKFIWTASIKK